MSGERQSRDLNTTEVIGIPMVVSMGLYRKHEMAKRNFVDFFIKSKHFYECIIIYKVIRTLVRVLVFFTTLKIISKHTGSTVSLSKILTTG